MLYSMMWTADPRFQPPPNAVHAAFPRGRYVYNHHCGHTYCVPYTPSLNPHYYRRETAPVGYSKCISKAEMELNQAFRTLWEQHVAWTRMLIISIAEELKDEALVTERLLRNAPDMAAVFERYYGKEIAAQFELLMRDHLVFAAELVKAAKAGNKAAAAEAERKWYANADEIAMSTCA
ncbi:hypothetical protein D3C77_371750 [compost metagenome]